MKLSRGPHPLGAEDGMHSGCFLTRLLPSTHLSLRMRGDPLTKVGEFLGLQLPETWKQRGMGGPRGSELAQVQGLAHKGSSGRQEHQEGTGASVEFPATAELGSEDP